MFIEAYFAHYHTQYPILHEPTFKAQLAEVIPQPPHVQWVILSNVVLGLGAFCASQPMYMIDYFLERATRVITVDHLETGSLVLVQAFTLLSNLAQKRNKINSGSIYLGIAVRMAIGLGLHRELPLWNIKPFEREVRRRVWWVVFIFDAGASITFGRPIVSIFFAPTP
jgi:transcriptional regulatory protein GAL4